MEPGPPPPTAERRNPDQGQGDDGHRGLEGLARANHGEHDPSGKAGQQRHGDGVDRDQPDRRRPSPVPVLGPPGRGHGRRQARPFLVAWGFGIDVVGLAEPVGQVGQEASPAGGEPRHAAVGRNGGHHEGHQLPRMPFGGDDPIDQGGRNQHQHRGRPDPVPVTDPVVDPGRVGAE